jgi:flagellar basal body-associated protein FliL
MVDEAKTEAPENALPSGRRKRMLMVGILAGVMILESVVVFVLVKSWSPAAGPSAAQAAANGLSSEGEKAPKQVEVKVGDFRAQNRRGQQTYVLDFSVFAKVAEKDKAKLEEEIAAKSATLKDRLVRVVRAMEPERFTEPDLTTLRTQTKEALREVLGAELKIDEVLLTDFTAMVEN